MPQERKQGAKRPAPVSRGRQSGCLLGLGQDRADTETKDCKMWWLAGGEDILENHRAPSLPRPHPIPAPSTWRPRGLTVFGSSKTHFKGFRNWENDIRDFLKVGVGFCYT